MSAGGSLVPVPCVWSIQPAERSEGDLHHSVWHAGECHRRADHQVGKIKCAAACWIQATHTRKSYISSVCHLCFIVCSFSHTMSRKWSFHTGFLTSSHSIFGSVFINISKKEYFCTLRVQKIVSLVQYLGLLIRSAEPSNHHIMLSHIDLC